MMMALMENRQSSRADSRRGRRLSRDFLAILCQNQHEKELRHRQIPDCQETHQKTAGASSYRQYNQYILEEQMETVRLLYQIQGYINISPMETVISLK